MTVSARPLDGVGAIVTGSARNIGRSIALALAADGAGVVVHAAGDRDAAQSVADEIRAAGGGGVVEIGDLREPETADRLVARAVTEFGRLGALVCNAAIRRQQPFVEMTLEQWREVIGVDLDAVFLMCRAAAPRLIEGGGGSIVCLGGSPSHLGTRGRAHVCAAKMGVVGLSRVLASELGPHDINVNVVAPGHIDTVRGASAGQSSTVTEQRPMARRGLPREVAAAVRHLCRPDGRYITGQTLHVNGGMLFAGA